jgi:hypothetical protein
MKLSEILTAKKPGDKIGFYCQGGIESPFIRYNRYSYPEEFKFEYMFESAKARLINEVDVYPEGIIEVRNFNGTVTVFVVEGLYRPNGKKISKEEFEKTVSGMKELAIEGIRDYMAEDSDECLDAYKSRYSENKFHYRLRKFIEPRGREYFDNPDFNFEFTNYLGGEYEKEAQTLKTLIELQVHHKVFEYQGKTGKGAVFQKLNDLPEFKDNDFRPVVHIFWALMLVDQLYEFWH